MESGPDTRGTLSDTYVAALQHDLVDVSPETTLVGVVRKPAPWFHAAVDENRPELGPPATLLESVREIEDDLKMQGLCDEGSHNATWEQIGSAKPIASCDENTEKKRCRRTILREPLECAEDPNN
ncbi:hypothetical protein D8Y22_18085 [Salinadaptatus halalkaliphilus]|uniref:Uncharacterized protein n=1 Tax=Salinadaptatus halalkaliphilus TaxID=2419781 RepID=A0A4S3TIE6_9EURY|nr:hypothetical protein [Salinadaptatus halalkaliphilus]THE63716.1 hypothetical protein D8Y22_18085 [Salinadaptatus halalkaliphilus]